MFYQSFKDIFVQRHFKAILKGFWKGILKAFHRPFEGLVKAVKNLLKAVDRPFIKAFWKAFERPFEGVLKLKRWKRF
jgi:hypothetical protein